MALREILIWPDSKLMRISKKVEKIDDSIKELVADMFDTMYEANGIGLAAPQIDVPLRICIVDLHGIEEDRPSGEEPIIMINPEFTHKEGELTWEEGCLSVPDELGDVTRAAYIEMKYLDLDGKEHTLQAEELKAVALQHEVDHLDGKLFVDYLSRLKKGVIKKRMIKLRKAKGLI